METLFKPEVERIAYQYLKMACTQLVKPFLKELLDTRLVSGHVTRLSQEDIENVKLMAHDMADYLCKEMTEGAMRRYKLSQR